MGYPMSKIFDFQITCDQKFVLVLHNHSVMGKNKEKTHTHTQSIAYNYHESNIIVVIISNINWLKNVNRRMTYIFVKKTEEAGSVGI